MCDKRGGLASLIAAGSLLALGCSATDDALPTEQQIQRQLDEDAQTRAAEDRLNDAGASP